MQQDSEFLDMMEYLFASFFACFVRPPRIFSDL